MTKHCCRKESEGNNDILKKKYANSLQIGIAYI